MGCCRCSPGVKATIIIGIGVLLVIIGAVLGIVIKKVVHKQVKEKVVLEKGTMMYDMWRDIPFPVYQQFYIFNVDNPAEVLAGHKPNLTQRGPYTYREHRVKTNLTFSDDGKFITYGEKKYFVFVSSMSIGNESDTITTINPLLPTLSQLFRFAGPTDPIRAVIDVILGAFSEDLFHTKSVHDILWGYPDPLLAFAHNIAPNWFYTDIVGYMAGKNNSYDGYYKIYTGKDEITKLGDILLYNGSRTLDFWTSNISNMLNGSDGSLHPPFVKKSTILYSFVTDVCRSIQGVYRREKKSEYGIHLYEFIAPASLFANKSVNPDNAGFCTPSTNCLGTGMLNVSTCQTFDHIHMPAVLSNPHFLEADPKYQDAINGLDPNEVEHKTTIEVEPLTGLMMAANKRLQVNIYITQDSHFRQLKNVNTMVMPVMWLNESTKADKKSSEKLDKMVFLPQRIAFILRIVIIVIGCLLILAGLIYYIVKCSRKDRSMVKPTWEKTPLITDSPYRHHIQNQDDDNTYQVPSYDSVET